MYTEIHAEIHAEIHVEIHAELHTHPIFHAPNLSSQLSHTELDLNLNPI